METGAVEATRRAVCPGQAAVFGGALWRPVLLTPKLAADVTVRRVGAVDEVLPEDLLALLVQAVLGAWQGFGQRHGTLWVWDVQQAVPCGDSTEHCVSVFLLCGVAPRRKHFVLTKGH